MRYQPQGLARLGRSWPSLAGAAAFNANARIPGGGKLSPDTSVTTNGVGATVALLNEAPVSLGVPVTASWSLLMVIRRDVQVTFPYFMGVSGGAYQVAMVGQHSSIGNRMGWFDSSTVIDSGFVQSLGSTDVIGLTFDGASNRYSWFKNGKAYNSTIGVNTGGGTWQLAAVSYIEYTTNTFPLLVIAPRAAPDADMLALTANPWQLFVDSAEDEQFIDAAGAPGGINATLSRTFGAATTSGAATAGIQAAFARSLAPAQTSGAAAILAVASFARQLGALGLATTATTGAAGANANAAIALSPAQASAAGALAVTGQASLALAPAQASATLTQGNGNIFYLDLDNGNDALDGTSFATRWKTMAGGPTVGRVTAGDTIRIMASPDPTLVGSATWNQYSKTVTLAAANTAMVCDCQAAWTPSVNVTSSFDTVNFKENTRAVQVAVAAAFTTGLAAYFPTGALDLSSYQQLSFWVYSSGTAPVAGAFSLRLCSDAAGAVPVHTIPVPALATTGRWSPITVDLATNLSAAINSIALYQDTDTAATTLTFDNILACKAASAPDALTLTSLIGKAACLSWSAATAYTANDVRKPSQPNRNGLRYAVTVAGTTGATEPAWPLEVGTTVQDGGVTWTCAGMEETWYPIQSIKGTTVLIDNETNTSGAAGRGYSGSTETVPTWRRDTIKRAMQASANASVGTIPSNGTLAARLTYSGGWARTNMAAQTGETWLDGQNGNGAGINCNATNYLAINNVSGTRFSSGLYEPATGVLLTNTHWVGCANGLAVLFSNPSAIGIGLALNNNSSAGLSLINPAQSLNLRNLSIEGNLASGYSNTSSYRVPLVVNGFSARNNAAYGLVLGGSAQAQLANGVTGNNTSGAIQCAGPDRNILTNCLLPEAVPVVVSATGGNVYLASHKHNQVADNHFVYTDGGIIQSSTDQRHSAGGISWKFRPTATSRTSYYPLRLSVLKIACAANNAVNVTIWTRRDNTNIIGQIVLPGGQLAGVPVDIAVTCTPGINTWVQSAALTFTPTEAGVVELQFRVWDGVATGNAFWIDDIAVS